MPEYTPEQLWPLYEKLPNDLQEAIFSTKTADNIFDICTRNNIEEKEMSEIAKYTGYVLLGLLSPDELEKTLKEELKLKNDLAKKISWEISRFIFFPLKESLEMLYKIEIERVGKMPETTPPPKEKPKKDVYRETIE